MPRVAAGSFCRFLIVPCAGGGCVCFFSTISTGFRSAAGVSAGAAFAGAWAASAGACGFSAGADPGGTDSIESGSVGVGAAGADCVWPGWV